MSKLPTIAFFAFSTLLGSVNASESIDRLSSDGRFDSLSAALLRSGLLDEIPVGQAWTLLAPNDEAFAQLGDAALRDLLASPIALRATLDAHLLRGNLSARDLVAEAPLARRGGAKLAVEIEEGQVRIAGALLGRQDLSRGQLRIHELRGVLAPSAAMLRQEAVVRIEAAVAKGAPLYNKGDKRGCVELYVQAVRELAKVAEQIGVARELRLGEAALGRAKGDEANAWALRAILDAVWSKLQEQIELTSPDASDNSDNEVLFSFDANSRPWKTVNDDVMGGVSKGGLRIADGVGIFEGRLSLRNRGGFASTRSEAQDLGLRGWRGLELRVRGDGRRYALVALRSSRRGELRTWRREFETKAGEWQTLRVPFAEMSFSVMGRRFPGQTLQDPSQVRSIGLFIADKDDSRDFRLEVDSISKYR